MYPNQKNLQNQHLERDSHCAQRSKITSADGDSSSTQLNPESVMSGGTLEGRYSINGDCSTSKECKILNKRGRLLASDSEDDIQVLESIGKDTSGKVKMESGAANEVNEMVDVIDIDSDTSTCQIKSEKEQEYFHCTVCHKVLGPSEISRHPLLEVTSCKVCYRFIKERMLYKVISLSCRISLNSFSLYLLSLDAVSYVCPLTYVMFCNQIFNANNSGFFC